METKNYKVTEILHHLGEEDLPFGAVNPPIFQTSIFSFKTFADFKKAMQDETSHYIYSRGNNPTVNIMTCLILHSLFKKAMQDETSHYIYSRVVSSTVNIMTCLILHSLFKISKGLKGKNRSLKDGRIYCSKR